MLSSIKSLLFLIGRFRNEILSYKWILSGAFLLLLLEVFFLLLEPWPIKFIIDNIVKGDQHADNARWIIILASLAFISFAALRSLATYWQTVAFAVAGNKIIGKIRTELYTHLQCLPLGFFNKARTGDLLVKMVSDMSLLQEVIVTALIPLAASILIMSGIIIVMLSMNWQLTLIAMCIIPLFILANWRLGSRIKDASLKQRHCESDMAATAAESINGIRTIQALSMENAFNKVFSSSIDSNLKQNIKIKRLTATLGRTVDILIAAATALVLWYGANLVLDGSLTAGDLVVFLSYLRLGYRPARNFAKYTGRITKALAAGERIASLFELSHDHIRNTGKVIEHAKGNIVFHHVCFNHEDSRVLSDLNFTVDAGETIAVIGPSGSGKSTMLNLLLRLYSPTSGEIQLDGVPIKDYEINSYRSQISVVMQETMLFVATIEENIAFGLQNISHTRIRNAAQLASAHGFISGLPNQYQTQVGEKGITLSAGQCQRIAIARAILRDAPIILLDEPTTGLDMENTMLVNQALKKLSTGRTVIFATHDLEQAIQADKTLLLVDGHVKAFGAHEELINNNPAYRAFMNLKTGMAT